MRQLEKIPIGTVPYAHPEVVLPFGSLRMVVRVDMDGYDAWLPNEPLEHFSGGYTYDGVRDDELVMTPQMVPRFRNFFEDYQYPLSQYRAPFNCFTFGSLMIGLAELEPWTADDLADHIVRQGERLTELALAAGEIGAIGQTLPVGSQQYPLTSHVVIGTDQTEAQCAHVLGDYGPVLLGSCEDAVAMYATYGPSLRPGNGLYRIPKPPPNSAT